MLLQFKTKKTRSIITAQKRFNYKALSTNLYKTQKSKYLWRSQYFSVGIKWVQSAYKIVMWPFNRFHVHSRASFCIRISLCQSAGLLRSETHRLRLAGMWAIRHRHRTHFSNINVGEYYGNKIKRQTHFILLQPRSNLREARWPLA